MFGIWRFVLALVVVFAHYWGGPSFNVAWMGEYAVHAFFVLSGYLITLILHEKYHFTWEGLRRYALNRLLRIYPSYFAAVGLTMLCLLLFGSAAMQSFHEKLCWPSDAMTWLRNFTIVGLAKDTPARFAPAAWALDIEIVFYVLMALLLGRSLSIGVVWFVMSLAIFLLRRKIESTIPGLEMRYLEKSLYFATGSLLYHLSPWLKSWKLSWQTLLPVALVLAHVPYVLNVLHITDPYAKVKLVNVVAMALLVYALSLVRLPKGTPLLKWDKFCGDLSYPVYLLHWQAGFLGIFLINLLTSPVDSLQIPSRGPVAFLVAVVATLGLSLLEVRWLSGPIESYRHGEKK